MTEAPCRPSWVKVWTTAARPHTLTASLSPCLVSFSTSPNGSLLLLWILFCVSIQIGTNLHNDYSDYVQGTDRKHQINKRATAQGWLSPYQTCVAATSAVGVSALAGVLLLHRSHQLGNGYLWIIILSSLFNAFAYTGGPYPLGYIGLSNWSIAYAGLGDLFVFVYFGLVATFMVPYLEEKLSLSVCIHGIQTGLLAMNILVVNNLRDRRTDVLTHKRTTAVRFGRKFSVIQYLTCLALSYGLVIFDAVWSVTFYRLMPLLSVPLALSEARAVCRLDGPVLNPHVGGAAKVQFLFCILLCLGVKLSEW